MYFPSMHLCFPFHLNGLYPVETEWGQHNKWKIEFLKGWEGKESEAWQTNFERFYYNVTKK